MNLYMRSLTAITISVGIMLGGGQSVSAACAGATITNTGPGSINQITCVDASEVSVTCVNNINVVTSNSQTGTSGGANGTGNTNSADVITGNATNENGTVVQIGSSCEEQPAVAATAPAPTTPPSSENTSLGGSGAAGDPGQQIAVLPNTASNSFVKNILTATLALTILLIISQVGIGVYRRIALR